MAIAYGSPQEPSDDIACLGVGRHLPVSNGKGHCPAMIGHDAYGHVYGSFLAIWLVTCLANGLDEGHEEVGIIGRFFALEHHG